MEYSQLLTFSFLGDHLITTQSWIFNVNITYIVAEFFILAYRI
jgi:hypothetical protein